MRLEAALEKYVTQLTADGRSAHTINQYRRHVALLVSWLEREGHTGELAEIGHEVLARFLSSPEARTRPDGVTKKATSMNALRSTVRTFFCYLHRAGDITRNPARLIRRALCEPPPPRALSERDQKRLLSVLGRAKGPEALRDYTLFHLMLATGIRLGSALGMDVEDLDLRQGEVRLRFAKGGREDRLYLGKAIRAHLHRFVAGRASGPLFTGRRGARISGRHVQRRLALWLKTAGVDRHFSPHDLRHSFALGLYRRTGDIFLVRAALRHRSIESTTIYAHVEDCQLRRALS